MTDSIVESRIGAPGDSLRAGKGTRSLAFEEQEAVMECREIIWRETMAEMRKEKNATNEEEEEEEEEER